jgi:murein DD-endopeptidase MepM/ murein hydrolase activator NlpD
VALVARFYLAGNVIYLDHGGGLISGYFHLSKTLVKTGQVVEKGQLIGRVGRTGRVTGPHLHWIMRYGGITLDPMSVLSLLGKDSL